MTRPFSSDSAASKQLFRTNNFDLLRLFAASQVAILHGLYHMDVQVTPLANKFLGLLYMFPGVPIFFFISGYLISKSFESNSNLSDYSSNRILRLFPALILAVTLSFLFIFASGYAASVDVSALDWIGLFLAKISLVQFYNPDFMRGYGDGVLNGSLWTITVELQFYLVVPLLYWALKLKEASNRKLLILVLVFFGVNRIFAGIPYEYQKYVLYKLFRVSFLPWFYMFLVGICFQKNFVFLHGLLVKRFWILLTIYVGVGLVAVRYNMNYGNNINPLFFVLLAPLIFAFSYSFPWLAAKTTRGNDFSYGIYIFHMPVINFMLYLGFSGNLKFAFIALLTTTVIAAGSWFLLERNCLKLKNHPFNPIRRKTAV